MLTTVFCLFNPKVNGQTLNWNPLATIAVDSSNSVLVSYAESCMDSTAVLVKFTNNGNIAVHLNWSLFSFTPTNELELNPNEVKEGICSGFETLKEFIPSGMSVANINLVYTIQ